MKWLSAVLAIIIIFVLSKGIIRSLPGDPIETIIAETGLQVNAEALRAELRLDLPFHVALWEDAKHLVKGDMGRSIVSGRAIRPMLLDRFSNTLLLTFTALMIALMSSLGLGIGAARSSKIDSLVSFWGAVTAALPTPWVGPIFIYVFSVKLLWFAPADSLALPAITLAIGFTGLWSRLIRNRLFDSLSHGSIQGARARGVPEWKALLKYGFGPTAGALMAYLGTQVGGLLSGAFITEIIFNWPGMGRALVEAVLSRDYPVVEAAVLIGAAFTLLGTLTGDFAQKLYDPRIKA